MPRSVAVLLSVVLGGTLNPNLPEFAVLALSVLTRSESGGQPDLSASAGDDISWKSSSVTESESDDDSHGVDAAEPLPGIDIKFISRSGEFESTILTDVHPRDTDISDLKERVRYALGLRAPVGLKLFSGSSTDELHDLRRLCKADYTNTPGTVTHYKAVEYITVVVDSEGEEDESLSRGRRNVIRKLIRWNDVYGEMMIQPSLMTATQRYLYAYFSTSDSYGPEDVSEYWPLETLYWLASVAGRTDHAYRMVMHRDRYWDRDRVERGLRMIREAFGEQYHAFPHAAVPHGLNSITIKFLLLSGESATDVRLTYLELGTTYIFQLKQDVRTALGIPLRSPIKLFSGTDELVQDWHLLCDTAYKPGRDITVVVERGEDEALRRARAIRDLIRWQWPGGCELMTESRMTDKQRYLFTQFSKSDPAHTEDHWPVETLEWISRAEAGEVPWDVRCKYPDAERVERGLEMVREAFGRDWDAISDLQPPSSIRTAPSSSDAASGPSEPALDEPSEADGSSEHFQSCGTDSDGEIESESANPSKVQEVFEDCKSEFGDS